ncbi:MAG: hypothetical protein MUD01_23645 [Chloroflexaceae bacterium]|jgi:hypothetical protein|nr:hypothetical protein [Chloroflexaceae bacterium]
MQIISTKVHGVLDYVAGLGLILLPFLLGWPGNLTTLMIVVAAAVLISSLITRYELSVAKILPMRAHLILDGLAGIVLIGAAFWFRDLGTGVFTILLLLGLFELGAALLTEQVSPIERTGEGQSSGGPVRPTVGVYDDRR